MMYTPREVQTDSRRESVCPNSLSIVLLAQTVVLLAVTDNIVDVLSVAHTVGAVT